MRNFKYRVTKDGMFLIRLKDEKKIPIPSPIKLRNYGGLRTQLDVGTGGTIQAIKRSTIDESEFSLGDPALSNTNKSTKKAPAPKISQKNSPAKQTDNPLRGAFEFLGRKVKELEDQLLRAKQIMNFLARDLQEPLPFPEEECRPSTTTKRTNVRPARTTSSL